VGAPEQQVQVQVQGGCLPPNPRHPHLGGVAEVDLQVDVVSWCIVHCRRLQYRILVRPRNPRLMSECILLPEYIPGDYPAASLMVQELPALVVIMIGNECAEPSVCSVLGLFPLVLLQLDIGQASPDTQIGEIGLVAILELKGGAAKCMVREAVVDVVGGMSSLCPP